jgi:hypothetical protein
MHAHVLFCTCSSDAYAVWFLPYWVFILLAPIGMVLALLYAITENMLLGVAVSYFVEHKVPSIASIIINSSPAS